MEPAHQSKSESNDKAAEFAALSVVRIREHLRAVEDPELFVSIVDLGLIYSIEKGGF